METREFYRRHLPHYHPEYGKFHIVFRLEGSLPHEVVQRLKQEREKRERYLSGETNLQKRHELLLDYRKEYFQKFDLLLDGAQTGPTWLAQDAIAQIVVDAMLKRDRNDYDLVAFTVMPNHVHLIISTEGLGRGSSRQRIVDETSVARVCRLLKGATAYACNRALNRSGQFWQHESYDHLIRSDEELERTIWYVLSNPVKAGLVETWQQWRWNYVKSEFLP
jgi:REP element-mobilizing transposase RayT